MLKEEILRYKTREEERQQMREEAEVQRQEQEESSSANLSRYVCRTGSCARWALLLILYSFSLFFLP